MKIIGFGHRSRQGKDTCARFLINYVRLNLINLSLRDNLSIVRVGFADKLKDICQILFPELRDRIFYENHPLERGKIIDGVGKTPVQIWIEVGNKMREVWPDIWIELLFRQFSDDDNLVIVIPDVRYLNEVKAIKKRGGIVVKVNRPGFILPEDVKNSVTDMVLEVFEGWDYIIENIELGKLHSDVITIANNYLFKE